jgi:hypothetical protein
MATGAEKGGRPHVALGKPRDDRAGEINDASNRQAAGFISADARVLGRASPHEARSRMKRCMT